MGMATKDSSRGKAADASATADRIATADYIGRISAELRTLAQNADLPFLAYLIAMVEDEARSRAGG